MTPYDRWLHFLSKPGNTFPDRALADKIMAVGTGWEHPRRAKKLVNRVAKKHGASLRRAH